jgi:hypothetical protein
MPTLMQEAMARIVRSLAPTFKQAGFRKRRHSFNRAAEDGIVHVVSFQMGPYDPPGTTEIPGLRENLYGLFTVNLGVFVPEMQDEPERRRAWINEYDCHLRKRLGELVPPGNVDIWWPLTEEDASAQDVKAVLVEHGLPWLEGLANRQSVLDRYYLFGAEALGMPPRARIDIARLHLALGDEEAADRELQLHWNDSLHPGHREHFAEELRELGREYLMDDASSPSGTRRPSAQAD